MTVELFVPGRLCLFGEHSDWAGAYRAQAPAVVPGRCLVAGTDQGLRAVATAADAVELSTVLPDGSRRGPERIPATEAALDAAARAGGFFSYAAGVAAEMSRRFGVAGVRLDVVANDLPPAKGLSSSAAVCVLTARAIAAVHGVPLGLRDEMAIAWAGERRAGSPCGLMDQVCAYGRAVTWLEFDGDHVAVERIRVDRPVHLLVVDLRGAKDTRRILADLHACYPAAPGAIAAGVREALGPRNAALLVEARAALERGDAAGIGRLMSAAQETFDRLVAPACPELRAPRLHALLAHPAVRDLGLGGKGVGSQGDGCAQVVARDVAARERLAAVLARDLDVGCLPLTVG